MIKHIKNNYDAYTDIYNCILPDINNKTAKRFLENSLYLSVFTSFEYFLKNMIENYVDNKFKENITYIQLDEGLARRFMLEKERECQINNIYNGNEEKSKKAFKAYFKKIKEPLSKEDLSKYVRFEFLHDSKLNTHYRMIFNQILGDPDFLENIRITKKQDYENINQEITKTGLQFISDYCQSIRNNIAHNNDKFFISADNSFVEFSDIIDAFMQIMHRMKEKYESHTGFDLSLSINENIIDSVI